MNRLRDDAGLGPMSEMGLDLIRGTAPTPRMPDLERRVWSAIQHVPPHTPVRHRLPGVKAAVLVVTLLSLVGTASAVISGRLVLPGIDLFRTSANHDAASASNTRAKGLRVKALKARPGANAGGVNADGTNVAGAANADLTSEALPTADDAMMARAPVVTSAPVRIVASVAPSSVSRVTPRRRAFRSLGADAARGANATRSRGERSASASAASSVSASASTGGSATPATSPAQSDLRADGALGGAKASSSERTVVLDALVALRRDHDAARAGGLLDGYLSAHRHGRLREEALVLSIEAADARGDGSAARRLARDYLAEFAHGRFVSYARSHMAAGSGSGAAGDSTESP